jgi:hypothetical protein
MGTKKHQAVLKFLKKDTLEKPNLLDTPGRDSAIFISRSTSSIAVFCSLYPPTAPPTIKKSHRRSHAKTTKPNA